MGALLFHSCGVPARSAGGPVLTRPASIRAKARAGRYAQPMTELVIAYELLDLNAQA